MSKILGDSLGQEESDLFEFRKSQSFEELLKEVAAERVVSLSKIGTEVDLREFLTESAGNDSGTLVFIVGGFAYGHFEKKVIESSDEIISISSYSLPAHVVTSRLTYELERKAHTS